MNYCFYHSADFDGVLSGFLVKHFISDAELIGINYGDEFPYDKITKEDTVYMVDFSLQPIDGMIRLLESCKRLVWIDHHISALKAFQEYPNELPKIMEGKRDNNFSGCELVWQYFSKEPMPEAVRLLGRYDIWDDSEDWYRILCFQYGLRMIDLRADDVKWYAYIPFNEVSKLNVTKNIEDIIHDGQVCLTFIQSDNKKYLFAYGYEITFDGLNAIVCNKGMSNSKLFDSVWDATKYDIMITYCKLKNHPTKWTVSLYSTKSDVDCSIIAKERGGGGHKGASGFQTDDITEFMPNIKKEGLLINQTI
uniref:Putative DHH family protein n=1 Tax=viral metagenome TaxID=1070528 RepID=A0A6H1Z9U9_9ZZZZ